MLTCPHCAQPLEAVRYGSALAWRCRRCQGHAVNYGVLRRTLPDVRWTRLRRAAVKTRQPAGIRCPSCRRPARRVSDGKMDLDACRKCQLFWFDARELESLPTRPKEKDLSPQAREAVARLELARNLRREEQSSGPKNLTHVLCGLLGLPFEVDQQPRRRRPWATILLTTAVLALGYCALRYTVPAMEQFAFRPSDPWRGHGLTILTYFFLHAGWLHLFGNAYFLAVFGDNVEEALGRLAFLLLVALGTAVGALVHAELDPRTEVPLVGASAGISAVMAYYALRFPRARIGWALRIHFVPIWWLRFPAAVMIVLWLGLQALLAAQQAAGLTNISAYGHLGGAAVGMCFWIVQRTMNA
jgi:membrane associated rhomboid family serine protease/Zn-finger nucleic acid-binding protein